MALTLAVACGGSSGSSAAPGGPLGPGTYTRSLSAWPDRAYQLYLPATLDSSRPAAVVIAIHGGGANALDAARVTCPGGVLTSPDCLAGFAIREGFVLVLPNGTPGTGTPESRTFNAGGGGGFACVAGNSCTQQVDDPAYFRELLDDVESVVDVDVRRVFATGISNGGAMAHRLGCQLADRIAAIGPVAGGNEYGTGAPCDPGRPVPVVEIHGDADPQWPYEGGELPLLTPPGPGIGVPATLAGWASRNGCGTELAQEDLPTVVDDGTSVTRLTYSGCSGNGDVVHYKIVGGGHTWPRGNPYAPESVIGKTSQQISANQILWDFFQAHPMP